MSVWNIVAGLFKPLAKLVDDVHTSDEERLAIGAALAKAQGELAIVMLDYERQIVEQKSKIIQAEATGHSWLQRNWRPLVMVWFCALLGMYWFGYAPEYLTSNPALVEKLFSLLQIGIGGYIVGRSAEKIIPKAVETLNATRRES